MNTDRRKLRKAFETVLKSWNVHDEELLAEELADAALAELRPKIDLSKTDPAWAILAGESPTQEQQDRNVLEKEARDEFERTFGFGTLPWFSNKTWTDFANFVARIYSQDKWVWKDYCQWREEDGKYNGKMTNHAIRNNPVAFMDTGYPTFEARKMYWQPTRPAEPVDLGSSDDDFDFKDEIYI